MKQNSPLAGGEVALFQTADGQIRLDVRLERETVWLTQAQMVELFGRDQSVISRHVRNVFAEGELPAEGNMQKMHIPFSDKPVIYYSLDVIISVGYRVKSLCGTQFRIWATRTLRDHLVQGYTLNERRLLCFIIKDHPFSDGNKRIGSFLFLLYLDYNRLLTLPDGTPCFADNALVAVALLVAGSDPAHKDLLIRLILNLLQEGGE